MANFGDHSISSAPANSKQEAGTPRSRSPHDARHTTHDIASRSALRRPVPSIHYPTHPGFDVQAYAVRTLHPHACAVRSFWNLAAMPLGHSASLTNPASAHASQCEASESPVFGMRSRVLPPSVSRDSSRLAVVLSDRKLQASHTRTRRDVRPLREPAGRQEPSPHLPGRIIRSGARTRCRLPSYLTMIPQTSLVSTYQQMGHGPSSHLSSM